MTYLHHGTELQPRSEQCKCWRPRGKDTTGSWSCDEDACLRLNLPGVCDKLLPHLVTSRGHQGADCHSGTNRVPSSPPMAMWRNTQGTKKGGGNSQLLTPAQETVKASAASQPGLRNQQTAWRLLLGTWNSCRGCWPFRKPHFLKIIWRLALEFWKDLRLNATKRSVNLSVYLVFDLEAGRF